MFLTSSRKNGADAVPPNEFRDFIRVVLREELHAVLHESIGDLQTQQTRLKEQQTVCTETMIRHMDRIHESLARFEKKMMPGIQMDPYEDGFIEPVMGPSFETVESTTEEDEKEPARLQRGHTSRRSRSSMLEEDFGCSFNEIEDIHEDIEEIEEMKEHQLKMALIDMIPNRSLAACLKRLLTFLGELEEPNRTGCAAKIMQSKGFMSLSMVFILADQLLTIFATNRAAATPGADNPSFYLLAERIFLAWFAFELCLRLYVQRMYFFILENWQINWLDLFLVTYSAFEQLGIKLTFMRALRIFKLAKVVRLLKALKEVRDLRIMVDCLLTSWFALFWSVVLIGFITYIFALIFVQMFTQYMLEKADMLDPDVKEVAMARFGSVQRAIVTLCKTFFGGFDWGDMYDILVQMGPFAASLGVFFALFFSVSVWNIVGSIFVEKVMETAKPHPREILETARIQSKIDCSAMREFFNHLDADARGTITQNEWQRIVEKRGLQEFMALRDVDLRDSVDINAFFALAQHEQQQCRHPDEVRGDAVPTEALMRVFLKVQGHASKLQVEVMLHELRARQGQITQILGLLRQRSPLHPPCVALTDKGF